jgi:hypothetical protein
MLQQCAASTATVATTSTPVGLRAPLTPRLQPANEVIALHIEPRRVIACAGPICKPDCETQFKFAYLGVGEIRENMACNVAPINVKRLSRSFGRYALSWASQRPPQARTSPHDVSGRHVAGVGEERPLGFSEREREEQEPWQRLSHFHPSITSAKLVFASLRNLERHKE